jgi:hypothetical protein
MSLFVVLTLGFSCGMIGVALFMVWWMSRVSHITITSRFQAAEFILEYHAAPRYWDRPKNPLVWLLQGANPIKWNAQFQEKERRIKTRLMSRLNELIAFFEICPFFQDEESRTALLAQLNAERDDWQARTAAEIMNDVAGQ